MNNSAPPPDPAGRLRILFVTSQWPTEENPALAPFVRQEVESLRRAGPAVDLFHYAGGWSPAGYARAIRRFRHLLRQKPYDLVHARFGQCGIIALAQRRLPVVVRFGGSDLLGWRDPSGREPLASRLLRRVSYQVARRADAVIVVSATLVPHLPPRPYHVLPSGVDLALFRPGNQTEARRRLGLPAGKKLILFAANPRNVIKRYHLAQAAVTLLARDHLNAFASLRDPYSDETLMNSASLNRPRHPRPSVSICGQSPHEPPAELIVVQGVPHEQMPLYMRACDTLILTSQHEGSPNVVKEALACNLPVVSLDVGDVRERIGRLPGCVVCADDRPETIAAALCQVLQAERPATLRDGVLHLDSDRQTQRLLQIYREMLTG